jgi:hypothetical protein
MKVGDKVWYVTQGYHLIIQCTITESFEYNNILFDIDEPVGHCVILGNDIFPTFEEAAKFFFTSHIRSYPEFKPRKINLDKWRDLSLKKLHIDIQKRWKEHFTNSPEKKFNQEWFGLYEMHVGFED